VHSVGLQAEESCRLKSVPRKSRCRTVSLAGRGRVCFARFGVPLQNSVPTLRLPIAVASLKYGPNSIRLTELQDKELRTFIGASNGPDINYVLTYSGTTDTDLAKRRNAFLDRYFHGASFSSEPDPKLSPDLIVGPRKDTF